MDHTTNNPQEANTAERTLHVPWLSPNDLFLVAALKEHQAHYRTVYSASMQLVASEAYGHPDRTLHELRLYVEHHRAKSAALLGVVRTHVDARNNKIRSHNVRDFDTVRDYPQMIFGHPANTEFAAKALAGVALTSAWDMAVLLNRKPSSILEVVLCALDREVSSHQSRYDCLVASIVHSRPWLEGQRLALNYTISDPRAVQWTLTYSPGDAGDDAFEDGNSQFEGED